MPVIKHDFNQNIYVYEYNSATEYHGMVKD